MYMQVWVFPMEEGERMAKGDIETYHEDGKWKNKVEGDPGVANSYDTRPEARKMGRQMAKKSKVEHVIKKKDGTVGNKNSYGEGPRNVEG